MKKTSRARVVLAGDVGGTKTRFGLFLIDGSGSRLLLSQTYLSKDFDKLESVIEEFLPAGERLSAAAFGVAGPVVAGEVKATNLPWKVSERALKKYLSLGAVSLMNDLVANARGIEVLRPGDFLTLNRGRRIEGNRALLSAGTGLGSAVLFWDGARHVPSPSEGGHADFGPRDRLEVGLLHFLLEQYGHVSYERVLSGAGLFSAYRFLRGSGAYGKEPAWLTQRLKLEDPAAAITEAARLGKSKLCEATLELFVSIYGAAAGNLALQVMATGGVFLGGGMAPKLNWKLREGAFMRAFTNKGRLSPIVARIPVKVIMNDQAALFGAAAYAAKMSGKTQ